LLSSALHGTAMRYAVEKRDLAESIAELRQIADGCNDILAEAAGITAGYWYSWPPQTSAMSVGRRWNVDHGWRRQRHTARLRRAGAVDTRRL
jgi:hypothetical protein